MAEQQLDYVHSDGLPGLLTEVGCSVLVSTYQAGQVLAVGVADGRIVVSPHRVDQAMGVAVGEGRLAVGSRDQVWLLSEAAGLAPRLRPEGTHDRAFLPRASVYTGPIQVHEMAWGSDTGADPWAELWLVNTHFNCLAGVDGRHNFVPRWMPPFISGLGPGDRCHLNGLAMKDGRPAFVTVMARTDEVSGWRADRNNTGTVLDVPSGEVVSTGLAMPHSPRWHDGRLYVLNSGWGRLEEIDPATGRRTIVAALPGYARGLAVHGTHAFVGLSKIRETTTFGGTPLAPYHDRLLCGVGVIDLTTGATVATLQFSSLVEEVFDVQVLPDSRCVSLGNTDGENEEIWLAPSPARAT